MSDTEGDFDASTISSKSLRPGMTEEEATAIRRPGTRQADDLWAEHTTAGTCDFDRDGWSYGRIHELIE